MPNTSRIAFLYGLITAEVAQARTYAGDSRVNDAETTILGILGKSQDDGFIWALAHCVEYTKGLEFHWRDGVPDSIRALEQFWALTRRGAPIAEWWAFYAENVDNLVLVGQKESTETILATLDELREHGLILQDSPSGLNKALVRKIHSPAVLGWHGAVEQGMKVWSPPQEWKLLTELSPEERADPLS